MGCLALLNEGTVPSAGAASSLLLLPAAGTSPLAPATGNCVVLLVALTPVSPSGLAVGNSNTATRRTCAHKLKRLGMAETELGDQP